MYKKIWEKALNPDEVIQCEFSIGDRYRKFWLWLWGSIIAVISFGAMLTSVKVGVWFLIITGTLLFFYYGFYLKAANAYAFTNKRILIHRGWLSTHTITVDYDKITDVTVREPFLDRIITKSGYLYINTAGTSTQEIVLRYISSPYETKKKLDAIRSGSK